MIDEILDIKTQSVFELYDNYKKDRQVFDELNRADLSSFVTLYEGFFSKIYVVAAAGLFENVYCEFIENEFGGNRGTLKSFLKIQAISRKYHTMFEWDKSNANKFYGLFGNEFKKYILEKYKDESEFSSKEKAFLELGNKRNEIVHKGIHVYNLNKTVDEVHELLKKAIEFTKIILKEIKNYNI